MCWAVNAQFSQVLLGKSPNTQQGCVVKVRVRGHPFPPASPLCSHLLPLQLFLHVCACVCAHLFVYVHLCVKNINTRICVCVCVSEHVSPGHASVLLRESLYIPECWQLRTCLCLNFFSVVENFLQNWQNGLKPELTRNASDHVALRSKITASEINMQHLTIITACVLTVPTCGRFLHLFIVLQRQNNAK